MSEIPYQWQKIPIQECCKILDSQRVPLNSEERYFMKGDIPYYGANGVVDWIDKYIFEEDLILVAEDGGNFEDYENRSIAYKISGKSWVNNHAHVLRVIDNYNFNFIFYSLEHKNLIEVIKGGTRSKLNQSELKEIPILCPKITEEQQKIASILENVDDTIDKTQEIIEKYEMIKEGLLHDLFKKEYKYLKLGDIAYIKGRIGWRGLKAHEYTDNGPYLIAGNHIKDDEIDWGDCQHISWERYYESNEIILEQNDIIISKDGTIGRLAFIDNLPGPSTINSTMMLLRVDPRVFYPKYLFYYLQTQNFKKLVEERISGSTVPHLFQEDMKQFYVKKMEIEKQIGIVNRLESIDKILKKEKEYLKKLQKIKNGLMQDLLTGKVRVKVEA